MAIVSSFGQVQAFSAPPPTWSTSGGSVGLYGHTQAYAEIYRTQPNVRICVDFLARNIAELTLQAFRRISDTDRVRLADHDLVTWLGHPNPATRRYRLSEALMGDLGIYFNAYWLKVRYLSAAGREAIGLVRLPPEEMTVEGSLLPSRFCWTSNGETKDFALSEIVYFNGYNPTNPLMGLSPLETLRRILAEEAAAGDHRESYWRNAGRMEGIIEQSKDAPDWKEPQKQQFREQWQEFSAGGAKAGMTAVLPRGMTAKQWSFSAKDSEYIQGGKLRREVCAAAFHIPQPLVGILDHATFSNIKEQHKHLYQDTLGPWLRMLKEEIEAQLLVECDDQRDVYCEFNIDAKLAGTPEERAASLQMAVGRPWRTVNEARALENLPRIDDPELDQIAPQQGGPAASAAPTDTPPAGQTLTPTKSAAAGSPAQTTWAMTVQGFWSRQQQRIEKAPVGDRASRFDAVRWNRELAADLARLTSEAEAAEIAEQINIETLALLEGQQPAFAAARDDHWPGERPSAAVVPLAVVQARVDALERRLDRRPVRRTFERDAVSGLVQAFTDTPLEEVAS